MTRRMLGGVLGAVALVGALGVPSTAASDGLPLPGSIAPREPLPGPDGTSYMTRHAGKTTIVRELDSSGGPRTASIKGDWWVPAVATDGSPGGVSADGSTLVLVQPQPRVSRGPTRLTILDARTLAIAERLTLHGAFSFDAISPDASKLYFIQYLSPRDPTRYAVRAYDLAAGRMDPDPIVDPNEHAGEMRGYPLTRRTSPDGRWDYTLYDGGGKEPFVHALDTTEGRAVCIDLNGLVDPRKIYVTHMAMRSDGRELVISTQGKAVAVIDTETLEARDPSAPAPGPEGGGGGGFPWIGIASAGGIALIGGGAVLGMRRRRRSRLATPGA